MKKKIDFVITWVDGSDPEWIREKAKYDASGADVDDARYRELGFLKYWFRAIEKNAPWVNKVHFVTYGHVPEWLNRNNPKLHIVKHEEFMDASCLPTFNSCAIEMNLHKIPELSEQFVYFNDDMFLNRPVRPSVFFERGRPRATYVNRPLMAGNHAASKIHYNCNVMANEKKDKKKLLIKMASPKNGFITALKNIMQYVLYGLAGFGNSHTPSAFLKSSYSMAISRAKSEALATSKNRFRMPTDISQWYCDFYQKSQGICAPKHNTGLRYYNLVSESADASKDIRRARSQIICINDTCANNTDRRVIEAVIDAFDARYPEKSEYEK